MPSKLIPLIFLSFVFVCTALDLESWAEAAENIRIDDIAPEIAKSKNYPFDLEIKPVDKKRAQKELTKRIQKSMQKTMEKLVEDGIETFAIKGAEIIRSKPDLMRVPQH
ncbi:unnamed protein product [Cylicostephanus goldi]|uniref:Uncharacterized protein n=1 Tax=Cylicostephanus goldi TaxID=71465 RepID=A0A3P6TF35_CYLGO|nr:unnamed protein product [Cylicostephanus goldi]